MAGDRKLLVGPFSAKHPRHWEPELHHEPLDRTHSDLVKFSPGDIDYERVHSRLREIVSKAKETLISRYLEQGRISDTHVRLLRVPSYSWLTPFSDRVPCAVECGRRGLPSNLFFLPNERPRGSS